MFEEAFYSECENHCCNSFATDSDTIRGLLPASHDGPDHPERESRICASSRNPHGPRALCGRTGSCSLAEPLWEISANLWSSLGIYYLRKSVFLIFLNNHLTAYYTTPCCLKRKNKKRFFSFQSMPNLNFAELFGDLHQWRIQHCRWQCGWRLGWRYGPHRLVTWC